MLIRTMKTIDEMQHPGAVTDVANCHGYIENSPPIIICRDQNLHDNTINQLPWIKMSLVIGVVIGAMMLLPLLFSIDQFVNTVKAQRSDRNSLIQEQELQNLFAQPFIDPLTDYIKKYERDHTKILHVERVITERNRRCAEIERRFQQQKKNYWTLAKLTKGYNYSCPDVVTRFAQ